ncbi:glucose-1-phosphate thymidylyltransferase [Fibrobacter sp. UWH9]|uniref:sugar nucleotidyltransferase n=1 Tax=unclassified Fibrobacter TaxID=2634177 RepID=UPI00091190E3|nr:MULTISPECIES: sugar phosphate nucleotidyltransferase [Fibrobacter]MCQ2101495.1 NTP transferase domain-containing protein [Fibrobacter sp.]MCL4100763.1 Bifunctional protein GlmU [Fibrobacter succinogenes]MDO4947620.1 sugar phosphate nucleotidyltransferase [Fibrobacter sp.]OWV15430.1 nucleotidyl transferase [Fibrobacter sp. UWH1]SHG92158.1 glucose-1-phosphate thymidylyltransferase [Fibrobacter sp. UWH9]
MKIVLPVAGNGLRLRPYTENLPKCLLPVAGKTILDWIVEDSLFLKPAETIFITGYKAETVDSFLAERSAWGKTRTVVQNNPQGLGEAISLALPFVGDDEPLLIILGDTLFEADLSVLEQADENILYTFKVEDPRRFGVAVTDAEGRIERLVEKPQEFVSDEAIVGIYYIKDTKVLKESLKYLMDNDIRTKNEFQLTDALEMMIQKGCRFRTAPVSKWLDCGLAETLLETNAHVLNRNDNSADFIRDDVKVIAPCYIGKDAKLTNCTIGPNVAVGDGCVVENCTIENAVLWNGVTVCNKQLDNVIIHE